MESLENILAQADKLLANSQPRAAIKLLEDAIHSYGEDARLYWKLAQLYTDPKKRRKAASKTVRYDKSHREARLVLKTLTQAEAKHPKPEKKMNLGLIVSLSILFSSIVIVLIIWRLFSNVSDRNVYQTQETSLSPTATLVMLTETAASPGIGPTRLPITATPTSPIEPFILRFYTSPITVSLISPDTNWNGVLNDAISELNRSFESIESETRLVFSPQPENADIFVRVIPEAEYRLSEDCPSTAEDLGCAWILAVQNSESEFAYDVIGQVRISTATSNPLGTTLHEMMHALGVERHSVDPFDIMFAGVNPSTQLSENDIALLRELYGR